MHALATYFHGAGPLGMTGLDSLPLIGAALLAAAGAAGDRIRRYRKADRDS